jgi:formylglycine-generating enzyme required for sulfatase activity
VRRLRVVIIGLWFLVGCTHRPVGTGDSSNNADMLVDAQLVTPSWVTISSGSFVMGSPASEPCREHWGGRETQHTVTLLQNYKIQTTEVTLGQFRSLMGYQPDDLGNFPPCGHSNCPAVELNWHQSVAYCNGLSAQKGLAKCYTCTGNGKSVSCHESPAYSKQKIYDCPGYRLPTEAEWEYAYRAGSTTAYYNGPSDPTTCSPYNKKDANAEKIAWYGLTGSRVRFVGQKQNNAWGLFDMAGNAWERCHDRWQYDLGSSAAINPSGASTGTKRVNRGGSVYDRAFFVRAAFRLGRDQGLNLPQTGFRCVRTIKP